MAATTGVPVKVRARGVTPVICAGRSWGSDPVDHVASDADVADFLSCPPLHVEWPANYVAPDGTQPGLPAAPVPVSTETASAERVARADADVARLRSGLMAANREINQMKAHHASEVTDVKTRLAETEQRLVTLQAAVQDAEKRAAVATERADQLVRDHAAAMVQLRRDHTAALDTERARHAAEMDAQEAARDKTEATLVAELDRATAPNPGGGSRGSKGRTQPVGATAP